MTIKARPVGISNPRKYVKIEPRYVEAINNYIEENREFLGDIPRINSRNPRLLQKHALAIYDLADDDYLTEEGLGLALFPDSEANRKALYDAQGNYTEAAEALGISRATLMRRAKKWHKGHRRNPEPRDMSAGVKKYLEFHDLEPKTIGEFFDTLSIPGQVWLGGPGKWIAYRSGKWTNRKENYIHDHKAGVKVGLVGQSTDRKIGVPAFIRNAKTLVKLGDCLGFGYDGPDGEVAAEPTGRKPEVYCTPNGKALLVIQDKKKILAIIWGGKLGVEARGIVN